MLPSPTSLVPKSNVVAQMFAQTMNYVPEDMIARGQAMRELEVLRRLFQGSQPFMCYQCGRPLQFKRSLDKTKRRSNAAANVAVPIGAVAPKEYEIVPNPTLGKYFWLCTGKDAGAAKDAAKAHEQMTYASVKDYFAGQQQHLTPEFQGWAAWQMGETPAEPWTYFSEEDLQRIEAGQLTWISNEVRQALAAPSQ